MGVMSQRMLPFPSKNRSSELLGIFSSIYDMSDAT